uniref:C-type lectin domain-containing protein n=1 Tax=Gouania willdenowi TaxID=441366 RepID=A0A8C5HEK2_GOUWI
MCLKERFVPVMRDHHLGHVACGSLFDHCLPGTIPCPKGGRINLINLRCYWLSVMTSSWFEAQESCSNTHGGELASAHNQDLQHFIFHSFPVETIEWVWLKEMGAESSEQGDVLQTESSIMFDQGYQNERMCAQMALGIVGRWRKAQCDGKFLYICEMKVTSKIRFLKKKMRSKDQVGLGLCPNSPSFSPQVIKECSNFL